MLKILPQNITLRPNSANPKEVINYINSYIKENPCENVSVDISFMNVIDACYVTTLCSASHFVKYPQGKINWKISSELVREFNKDFELGNADYCL